MKNLLCLLLILSITACAFKSKDGGNDPGGEMGGGGTDGGGGLAVRVLDPNGDLDGDAVTNKVEAQLGRKPEVADLPELQVAFLQNYKRAKSEGKTLLDTKVGHNCRTFAIAWQSLYTDSRP